MKDSFKSRSKKPNNTGKIVSVVIGVAAIGVVATVFSHQIHGLGAAAKASQRPVKKKTVAKPKPLPQQIVLQATPQAQNPQLPNGAEVTTLSMLLSAVHHPVSKMVLAKKIAIDPTKEVIKRYKDAAGQNVYQITQWGDPNKGYVGNMYHAGKGYGVYHGPVLTLLDKIWPKHGVDLTGRSFSTILASVGRRHPVEIWTTLNFKPATYWISWQSPAGKITATPEENAALIVGYNKPAGLIYLDNPGSGTLQKVPLKPLEQSWKQLGSQAVSVTATVPLPKPPAKTKHSGKSTHHPSSSKHG